MKYSFEDLLHMDLSKRLNSPKMGEYTPFDDTKIKSMTLNETLITLRMFQSHAWITSSKIDSVFNRYVKHAIDNKLGAIRSWKGVLYQEPQEFKNTLYKPYSEGGHLHYGSWYMDTQRVIPLLMKRLSELERDLNSTA